MDSLTRRTQQKVRDLSPACLIAAAWSDWDALLVQIGIDQHLAIDRCIQGRIELHKLGFY